MKDAVIAQTETTAKRQESDLMINVTVIYPNAPDKTFDMDYYLATHIPMVRLSVIKIQSARKVKKLNRFVTLLEAVQLTSERWFRRLSDHRVPSGPIHTAP